MSDLQDNLFDLKDNLTDLNDNLSLRYYVMTCDLQDNLTDLHDNLSLREPGFMVEAEDGDPMGLLFFRGFSSTTRLSESLSFSSFSPFLLG